MAVSFKVLLKTNKNVLFIGDMSVVEFINADEDINGRKYEVVINYNENTNLRLLKEVDTSNKYVIYLVSAGREIFKSKNTILEIYKNNALISMMNPIEKLTQEEIDYIEDNIAPMPSSDDWVCSSEPSQL